MYKESGRKRIKDRGIKWVEHYHERSAPLKKRFNKTIGPMAYMRWEGHDYTTDGDYFVIVGPSLTGEGKKSFFAGIKKLPDDPKKKVYAPSGEYFSSIHGAFSYASDKWNVPFPKGSPNYTVNDLAKVNIPRHIKGSVNNKVIIAKSNKIKDFFSFSTIEKEILKKISYGQRLTDRQQNYKNINLMLQSAMERVTKGEDPQDVILSYLPDLKSKPDQLARWRVYLMEKIYQSKTARNISGGQIKCSNVDKQEIRDIHLD